MGDTSDDVIVTDACQGRVALCDQLFGAVPRFRAEQPIVEAHLDALQVSESRFDAQKLVEARGPAVADVRLDDWQVDAELGPRMVVETSTSHVLDPPDLEIGDVGAVMDDAHQVGFAKANPYRVAGYAVRREVAFQEAREIT